MKRDFGRASGSACGQASAPVKLLRSSPSVIGDAPAPLRFTFHVILIVLLTITDFNVVVAMLVLTGGGPGNANEPMSLRMYHEAFTYTRMGAASAIAMIIFALNLVLSAIYIRLLRTERYY